MAWGPVSAKAPYLQAGDKTLLQPGMALVLGIDSVGPEGELITSKDTYVITAGGHRLLSWYRDWNRLYAMIGITARAWIVEGSEQNGGSGNSRTCTSGPG